MQIQFNFIYLLKLYDWILINDPRSYIIRTNASIKYFS